MEAIVNRTDSVENSEFFKHIDGTISSIRKWFTSSYLSKERVPYYAIDSRTGRPLGNRDLIPELDDYAPFLWMVGEVDFVTNQVRILKRRMKARKLLFSRPQIRKQLGVGLPGIFRKIIPYTDTQDFVEILYGLIELYELSKSRQYLDLAVSLFDNIVSAFHDLGFLRSFRVYPYGPCFSLSEAMSGMYIEIAADLFRLTGKTEYMDLAVEWGKSWIDTPLFKEYGVFQSIYLAWPWNKLSMFKRVLRRAELAKSNTSMASGLFTLASPPYELKWAEEALRKWVDGLYRCFVTKHFALAHTPRLEENEPFGPILSTNFAAMDILCDLFHFTQEQKFIDLPIVIADFFLSHQSESTGLFPDEIGRNVSYIDANTDLAVTLARLTELTGDGKYLEAGKRALTGVMNHHYCPKGFYRDVDMNTGEVINDIIETRFVSLLLKALVLYRQEILIYSDMRNWSIFRDR